MLLSPGMIAERLGALQEFYASVWARRTYGDHVCMAIAPHTVNGSPEDLVDRGIADGADIIAGWVDTIVNALAGARTKAQVEAELKRVQQRLDIEALAEVLAERMIVGAMLGALDSHWEHENEAEIEIVKFRGDPRFTKLPYDQAIRLWDEREVMSRERFDELADGLRRRAFTFAGAASDELLNTVHAELGRQLREGANLGRFQEFARERMESAGWTPSNPTHVETIFRTNMGTAYSSGRYAEMTQPNVLADLPYWQIRTVRDARQRPTHRRAHDTVLPADHEFWLRAFPPFGYNCRCRTIARTARWVERTGARIGPVPRDLPDPGFESGVAGLVQVPPQAPQGGSPGQPSGSPGGGGPPAPARPSPGAGGPPPPRPAPRPAPAPVPPLRPRPSTIPTAGPPPKPPPRETTRVGRERRLVRLSPEQQEAERTARWLRENPSVRREASVDERVQAIQWEWVSGSNRRAAVVLKEATKREFALEGDVWSRGIPYRLPDSDVEQARTDARAMFERTQAHFAEAGVKRVRLYRGLKPGSAPHRNSIESWTSDPNVARRFAGPGGVVLQQDFPVQQILTHHGVPGWIDGPYGSQAEYLVMR